MFWGWFLAILLGFMFWQDEIKLQRAQTRCEAVEVQEYVSPEGCTTDSDCEAREAVGEVWI